MRVPALSARLVALLLPLSSINAAAQSGWIGLHSGTSTTLRAVHFTTFERGYAVGESGVGLRTTDAGATWLAMDMGVAVDLHDVFFIDEMGVAVGDGGTILRTTDSGSSWIPVPSGVTDDILSTALSGEKGVCGALSQTILRTTDSGASWMISQSGYLGGGFYGTAMVSPDIAFVGGVNSIFQPLAGRSSDGGANWSFSAFYLDGNEGTIARLDFTDANIGYAACRVWDGRGAISKSDNGGQDWTTTLHENELTGISFPISNASQIGYAVGRSGTILKTTDAGTTWSPQSSGTSVTLRDVHFVDLDHGYAVGESGTILQTSSGGEPATAMEEGPVLSWEPGHRALTTVAPNPFRQFTRFLLQVPEGERAILSLYNAAGERVRTITDQSRDWGDGGFTWDGRDDAGRMQGSGVYLYRLIVDGRSESGAVLLVR